MPDQDLVLWHAWDSVSSIKVRMALAELGLQWESRVIDLMCFQQAQPAYLAINPKGVVPALEHAGEIHTESNDIIRWLDTYMVGPSLRSADPREQTRMAAWLEHEATGVFPAIRTVTLELSMKQVFARIGSDDLDRMLAHHPRPNLVPRIKRILHAPSDTEAVQDAEARLRAVFEHMEEELTDGPWLAGRAFTLADIALAPHVFRLRWLGLDPLWSGLPRATDWIARIEARPDYRDALPPEDKRLPKPRT